MRRGRRSLPRLHRAGVLLIAPIGTLAVCPPGRGQNDAGLIRDAALALDRGSIAWVGTAAEIPQAYRHAPRLDAAGRLVTPGLIDCHTHLLFGGWRATEFAARLAGKSYLEIAAGGGGIASTVAATRRASDAELKQKAHAALAGMLALGVTTIEAKSGYGLDLENELRILRLYRELAAEQPIDIVPTFLGAHVVPAEYRARRGAYLCLLLDEMLPRVAAENLAEFCDCFIDAGAFTLAEGEAILSRARDLGLKLKCHAEQFTASGAASLAARLGAVSVEHLERIDEAGIAALAAARTVAVSLPLASLWLGEPDLDARHLLAAGVAVAVATDFNPGSAPSWHLPLALTLACLRQRLTPAESLMAATAVAARAIARDGENQRPAQGSLLPGCQADIAIFDAPNVDHWLYHFRPNACLAVLKKGEVVWQNPGGSGS